MLDIDTRPVPSTDRGTPFLFIGFQRNGGFRVYPGPNYGHLLPASWPMGAYSLLKTEFEKELEITVLPSSLFSAVFINGDFDQDAIFDRVVDALRSVGELPDPGIHVDTERSNSRYIVWEFDVARTALPRVMQRAFESLTPNLLGCLCLMGEVFEDGSARLELHVRKSDVPTGLTYGHLTQLVEWHFAKAIAETSMAGA